MRFLTLSAGDLIPHVGQGCMGIGGEFSKDTTDLKAHIRALEFGIDLGMTLLDTAEVYADGFCEEIVGKAIRGKRSNVIVATKFSPNNHHYDQVIKAADRSLKRLDTDYIDIYQIHWPNPSVPLEDTIRALKDLLDMGKIRKIGVSNFSVRELKQAKDFLGEYSLFGNQVEYNLFDRSIEEEILPYCHQNDLTVMAYSPLDKGKVNYNNNKIEVLSKIAEKYQSSISQVVLNWLVTYSNVVVIPKAVNLDHVRLNAESLDFQLDSDDLIQIERAFDSTPIYVEPDKIRVSLEGEGNRNVYQTLQQALENPMGMS